MPMIIGVGGLALAVIVILIAVGSRGGGGDASAPEQDPAVKAKAEAKSAADTAAVLVRTYTRDFERKPPEKDREFSHLIGRLKRLGEPAHPLLGRVYRRYVDGPGKDDADARRFLGDTEFGKEMPEIIANRDYPYLKAAEAACAKRWFGPHEKEQLAAARSAWSRVEEHAKRLETDRVFRAVDRIRANVAGDPFLRNYNYATRWADPYLICYASRDRLSEFDLLSVENVEDRKQLKAEIEARKLSYKNILDEKALQFSETYKEFMRRYQKRFGLKPLMDEWGGRPDYEQRSFQDGCPLVVWIFSDHKAFLEHHAKVKRDDISPFVAGYFSPASGMVFLYDGGGDRIAEVNKNVHEAMHQLVHWFTRQKSGWDVPHFSQSFFGEGFAEWFGSVKMGPDRTLEFMGVNVPRVRSMQALKQALEAKNRKYPIFPLEKLATFSSYRDVALWGLKEWKLPPQLILSLFYQQSWALVRYLHDEAGRDRREELLTLFGAVLDNETGYHLEGRAFRRAFKMNSAADWKSLNGKFSAYVHGTIMRMDVERYAYKPPKLGEWR